MKFRENVNIQGRFTKFEEIKESKQFKIMLTVNMCTFYKNEN